MCVVLQPGQQYLVSSQMTVMELFECLARVAYHQVQSVLQPRPLSGVDYDASQGIAENAGDQFNSRDFLVPCSDLQNSLKTVIQQLTESVDSRTKEYEVTIPEWLLTIR